MCEGRRHSLRPRARCEVRRGAVDRDGHVFAVCFGRAGTGSSPLLALEAPPAVQQQHAATAAAAAAAAAEGPDAATACGAGEEPEWLRAAGAALAAGPGVAQAWHLSVGRVGTRAPLPQGARSGGRAGREEAEAASPPPACSPAEPRPPGVRPRSAAGG